MFETPLTIVGNVVTEPVGRRVGEQEMVRFRVASNSRRRTADGSWEQGTSLFVTVSCWGRLATGVAALTKGSPVVVVGQVHTSEYDDREGVRRQAVEVRASAVGPDLARSIVHIEHPDRTDGDSATAGTARDGDGSAAAAPEQDPDLPLSA